MADRWILAILATLWCGAVAHAETVTIEATRDTTLIEDPDGALANGAGPAFFVGHTGQSVGGIRRALIFFDVASAVPDGAILEHVALTLHLSQDASPPSVVEIHPLLTDWGEGVSSSGGGHGADAEPGDATWIHAFFDDTFWVHDGGDFMGRASASQEIDAAGFYTWEDTPHLLNDVRLWLYAPERNFGWILIGDEVHLHFTTRFDSRESATPYFRPLLTIVYRMPN